MNTTYIIDRVNMDDNTVVYKTKNGKWKPLYQNQSSLDGACAIISMYMCMLVVNLLPYKNIRLLAKDKDYEKFVKHFFKNKGMHLEGNNFDKLCQELKRLGFSAYVDNAFDPEDKNISLFSECILENLPIIIGVEWKGGGSHAMLAVGFEEDEQKNIRKVYCMDPDSPEPHIAPWNAYISLPIKGEGRYPHHYVSLDPKKNNDCRIVDFIEFDK